MKQRLVRDILFSVLALAMVAGALVRSTAAHAAPATSILLGGMLPAASQPLTAASAKSKNMKWHKGIIMPGTMNVYAIYWEPTGFKVNPMYNALMTQYYQDVGGKGLYNINTQYTGSNGAPASAALGGTWLDQGNAYRKGARLSYVDILNEVKRAIQANGWPTGQNSYFPVYTAEGVGSRSPFCGYHTEDGRDKPPLILFAHIVYPTGRYRGCQIPGGISPNGCIMCDSAINVSAHEQFEAATDPVVGTGWFYRNVAGEIGDLCNFKFGNLGLDGGKANQQWNGHFYIIQMMWDNKQSSCQQSGP